MKNGICIILCYFYSLFSYAQAPTWSWAKTGEDISRDCEATAIMTDDSGNVYAAGFYTLSNIVFGSDTLVGGPGARMFFNKYDKNGQLIWTRSSNSDSSLGAIVMPYSIKMDLNGYLYVAGQAQTQMIIWGQDSTNAGCGKDFVAKYDPQGHAIWGRFATSRGYDEAKSIALDNSGDIYMFGDFHGENVGFGSDSFYSQGGSDLLLIKYDSTGHMLWAKSFGGDSNDYSQTINIDRSGNLYLQGYFGSNSIAFGSIILINSDTGQNANMFLVKCDANGNVLWARNNSGKPSCNPASAAIDSLGNVYVFGTFGNDIYGNPPLVNDSIIFGNVSLTDSLWVTNLFLVKYDVNGNVVWAKMPVEMYAGEGDAYSVAVDDVGNVYLAGDFMDSNIISGTNILTSNIANTFFFAKYDPLGDPLWLKGISGYYWGVATCVISAGANNNVYMAAGINGPTLIFDSITLTIDSNGYRSPIIARLGEDAKLDEISTNTAFSADLFIEPNPLGNTALVKYSLPSCAKSVSLVAYDLLGRIKSTYKLNEKESQITINSIGLSDGVYFYSLEVDGKPISTCKIVVAK